MKKPHLKLSEKDLNYLHDLLSKGSLKVRKQKRAQALLGLNQGKSYVSLGKELNISYVTVSSWQKKYKQAGLSFLDDKPRSGRPIHFDGEYRAKITALACSDAPEGYARWSLRLLSDSVVELGLSEAISHNQLGKILKKMNYSLTEKGNGA